MNTGALRIRDLGELTGPVLVFGGPYSNLQASQALLALARAQAIPPERRICTGDVIAYCANPRETLALWQDNAQIVAGNCERQLAAGALDCGCGFEAGTACDVLSRGWFPFASGSVTDADRAFMAGLPDILTFRAFGRRYAVIHGGATDIARYLWSQSDDADFRAEIAAITALVGPVDGVFAGHCGIAFKKRIDGRDWINSGAIGMPAHDGQRQTQYAILGPGGIAFARLDYDAARASQAMVSAGLDQGYHHALLSGYWPSEDVLPPSMRRQPSRASG